MSKKVLYLDCSSGISGDMTVAALLSLGAEEAVLRRALSSLPLDGVEIIVSETEKNGIRAVDFDVVIDEAVKREERNLEAVLRLLENLEATENAKQVAEKIFRIAATAQAAAHGTTVDNVFFHEPGAVDSLVDIVSAAVCFDCLQVADVVLSPVCDGSGKIKYRYGWLPVPVPAVKYIADWYGLPLRVTKHQGEMVTPTGASIAAALWNTESVPKESTVIRRGYGAGKRFFKDGFSGLLCASLMEN